MFGKPQNILPEDKLKIRANVKYFAAGKMSYREYTNRIMRIIEAYNGQKIDVDTFTITVVGFRDNKYLVFQGKELNERCPACESGLWRYCRTQEENKTIDRITVFCMDCGSVYDTLCRKEEE